MVGHSLGPLPTRRGARCPRPPLIAPDIRVLRRSAYAIYIAVASITTASGLSPVADGVKHPVFMPPPSSGAVWAYVQDIYCRSDVFL